MARLGLALYLMLVIAAGPWLCCCSVGHSPKPVPATALPPSGPGACCGHDHAPAGPAPDDSGLDSSVPVPHAPCPCQDRQKGPSTLIMSERASGPESGESIGGVGPSQDGTLFAARLPGLHASRGAREGPIAFPFSAPRDILRALHVLRC